jgi:acyl-lipid omega-6 desaturase (Delta-12 desaturase)
LNDSVLTQGERQNNALDWRAVVAKYQHPSLPRSVWQLVNTLIPYAILWFLMYRSLAVSYWITLALAALTAGFQMRVFIIHHDCGHGSFFKSQRANDVWGFITGVLVWTPYQQWRFTHAVHHAGAADLDRRGLGAVWTMTVREYLTAPWWKRLAYRFVRNPLVLFVLIPPVLFLVLHRFSEPRASRRDRRSVYWTNLAMLTLMTAMSWLLGFKAYVMIQLPVLMVSSSVGVWLFYVQHQFEGVYWQRHGEWDYATAALEGSSFYKLPKVLQWFSGNIGFHHIHHLSPRIPNYNLEKCHRAHPLFQQVAPITLWSSWKSLTFRLWDEPRHRLVGYSFLRDLRSQSSV